MSPAGGRVVELVGVYHADGGPVGEAKYVIGKFLGTVHCALCDITHSPIRRKPEWDRMVARLGIPFTLVHLNEMTAEVTAAMETVGSPAVLARRQGQDLQALLGPAELEEPAGSVAAFEAALLARLAPGDADQ